MKVQTSGESGGNGSGRRRRTRRVTTSLAEINVVPLVDVMLVLLIIFMVTAPMMQRGLDVNLPVARRSQQISEERLIVTVPLSYRKDRFVQMDDETIRVEILHERIRQVMQRSVDKEAFLRADGALTVQEWLEVMDAMREGGVERVGVLAKQPGER
ncbi:MAG: biopolymer transporter ExbD [Vicinamibacterales bacterium]